MEPWRVYADPGARKLAQAVVRDDVVRLKRLIGQGADVNAVGDGGVNMLIFALRSASPRAFETLLDAGIDTGLRDKAGKTALHYAASNPDAQYMATILRYPVDVDSRETEYGETALLLSEGNPDQIRMLLAAGADPNVRDELGETILHRESMLQNHGAVLDILEAGADHTIEDRKGRTFQDLLEPEHALEGGSDESYRRIVEWLREHDVPTNLPAVSSAERTGRVLAVAHLRDGEDWRPAFRIDPEEFDAIPQFGSAVQEVLDELDRRGIPARIDQGEYAFGDPAFGLPSWREYRAGLTTPAD